MIAGELEEIRRAATEAAAEGNRRLRAAEEASKRWAEAANLKDRELKEMVASLEEARNAAVVAADAARELDDVKRQATRAPRTVARASRAPRRRWSA